MEFLPGVLGNITGGVWNSVFQSVLDDLKNGDDELGADQLIALGVMKSYADIHPEIAETVEPIAALGVDFETMRLNGVPNNMAWELTRLIYAPRISLVQHDYLPKEQALELDADQVQVIVENIVVNYLMTQGIDAKEDLQYDVGAIEDAVNLSDLL